MSTNVTVNGTSYSVPATGEENWGGATKVDGLLIALASHMLQKTGGTFTLSADVDFGASAGLKAAYYKSRGTVATTGILRLANAETVSWRNAADSGNVSLAVDSSNRLTFAGTVVLSSGGVVQVAAGGTGLSSYTAGDVVYASASTTLTKLGIGTASYVLKSDGSTPSWGQIVNASVDNSAAIARTKLASGTNYRILANDSSGVMSENAALTANHVVIADSNGQLAGEAALAYSRGGTAQTSWTKGDLLYASANNTLGKLAIGASGTFLKANASNLPEWASATGTLSVETFTSNDSLDANNDVALGSATGGSITLTLPAAASNTGKVYRIKKTTGTLAQTVTIDGNASETIDGSTTYVLYTVGEEIEIICDGSNWILLNHRTNTDWDTSQTMTIAGSTSAPTKADTKTEDDFAWRRVGDSMEIHYDYGHTNNTGAAAGSGNYLFTLPTGTAIDTAKQPVGNLAGQYIVGVASFYDGTSPQDGHAVAYSSTQIALYVSSDGNGAPTLISSTKCPINGSTVKYSFRAVVPISGWKA